MKHAYGKSGGPRAEIAQMRKPAHTKKVCGRNMTILLVSAYQTVLKKARSGPTTGAPAYGELTHISTRRAAETGIRIGVAHQPVCAFGRPHTRRFRRKHLRSLDASSPRSFTCPLLHGLTLETALTRSLPNLRHLYGGCRFVRSLKQTAVSVRPACRGQKLRGTC